MQFGGLHEQAKELRVAQWIDSAGNAMDAPLKLDDLGDGYKVIYCFQHWCPGCHSRGFPTLKYLHNQLRDRGVGFAVIQTVFEGGGINTFDKLRVNQEQYGLKLPFGHDVPVGGERHPTFMEDYRSGGTPWFTVIDPAGNVVHADFRIDADRFIAALDGETLELKRA